MARAKKQSVGYWLTEEGDRVWVSKAGGAYWISHGSREQLCHPSIRSLQDTAREALVVFHVTPVDFHYVD